MSNNCGENEDDGMIVDRNGKQKLTGHENEQERQADHLSWHSMKSVAAAAASGGARYSSFGRPFAGWRRLTGIHVLIAGGSAPSRHVSTQYRVNGHRK
jgi:hypothetical protein